MQIKLISAFASALIFTACNQSAQDQKVKADQAQVEADQKIARANIEAQQKSIAAQKEADDKIAQANARAQEETAKTQLSANQDIRQANDDALKARNDYQVETTKSLNQIDNKLDGLKVKAQSSQAKSKAQFDNMLPKVASQRTAVSEDLAKIQDQTPQSFAGFKTKTDQDIKNLRKMVDEVAMNL